MRFTALLLLLLLASPGLSQEAPPVRVVTDRMHALFYMLECLLGEPHRSPQMAATFRARVGDWTPVEEALEGWRESLDGEELSRMSFPSVGGRRPDLGDVLERVALQSDTVSDMISRVRPWLGPKHAARLESALRLLEPLHRTYWWDPGLAEFQQRKAELEQRLKTGRFEEAMVKATVFYDSSLPANDPPTLALLPYQKAPGETDSHTNGHSQGGLQVLEIVIGSPEDDAAGVVFHEFMHYLWFQQSDRERARWRDAFLGRGVWGRVAYVQFNEGLATALGNGWFNERVLGKLDQGSWYADNVIDAYAHALYPIIKTPLDQGRAPTDAELSAMVDAFQEAVPDALQNFNAVASELLTVSSRQEINMMPFQREVMKLGPVHWSRTRSWEEAGEETSSFTLYWLSPGEQELLLRRGWSKPDTEFVKYRLRRTESGWELGFLGSQEELFDLLRDFQANGLEESAE